jgi:peptide/nickel transport system permease protein
MERNQVSSQARKRHFGDLILDVVVLFVRKIKNEVRLALRTTAGRIGLPIVVLHLILALFGPWITPYTPTEFHEPLEIYQLQAPSAKFWLGTDQFGRDVLSRVMAGASTLIGVSLGGAVLGILLGTIIGMTSGYKGGKIDEAVMRIMDGLMSFPTLLMALLVMATLAARPAPVAWLEPRWIDLLIVLTIGVVNMPRVARVMRSTMLKLKEMEFVQSARLRGEPAVYIIFMEILPNAVPTLAVELSVRMSYAILTVSSLGFLGLGVQPPSPDWGLMIFQSRQFLMQAPWVAFAPIVAVATLVLGINLLTDGLRQARGLPLNSG